MHTSETEEKENMGGPRGKVNSSAGETASAGPTGSLGAKMATGWAFINPSAVCQGSWATPVRHLSATQDI